MVATGSNEHINLGNGRDAFIFGDRAVAKEIQTLLGPLPHLFFKPVSELKPDLASPHIILAICDFGDVSNMQMVAKSLFQFNSAAAHKIVFSLGTGNLDQQHLLFAIELGAKFTAYGPNRDFRLKEYMKRIVMGTGSENAMESLGSEIENCRLRRDDIELKKIADKLLRFPKDNENVLRLQAIACQHLRLMNKAVYYLRKILSINPQNLWAANELGRLYLRSDRVSEGVEVLEKLSQFHDLNSERILHLGDAYLGAGRLKNAEKAYQKGTKLIGKTADDERFKEGLAKVKVAEGDVKSALALLGKPVLSENVLAFINMRAIMAIRNKQIEDGIRFYQLALDGCREDKVVRSKLFFNMGLAFVKISDDEKAVEVFEKSVELGGEEFSRAVKPLDISRKAVSRKQKESALAPSAKDNMDDLEEIDLDEIS